MHRFMDASCSNCNKFSHCCNNDLICISKYREKEEECEGLKEALDEIRQYRVCEINDEDGEEGDVILGIIDEVMEQ